MKVENFIEYIKALKIDDLIGIPDSTLKQFCDFINREGSNEFHHYVPQNEGGAIGIAIGTYLATGKPACVYMQNSGLGNIVNPITSLANKDVYNIPMLLLVGWRGEPGIKDEPQHKFMGKITEQMLTLLGISFSVISNSTTEEELGEIFEKAKADLNLNRQYAIVIKRDTFDLRNSKPYKNDNLIVREEAIAKILKVLKSNDIVVSTTGKISRELYEESDLILGQHSQEFLTVGGMGHASMIAFGLAEKNPGKRVFCLDGDGAVLMHMGALPFIGKEAPGNFIHICLNNEAHESVGGMPTGAKGQSYSKIALNSGYKTVSVVEKLEELDKTLNRIDEYESPVFLEIMVAMDSRKDLGRPKESAEENKDCFMKYHEVIR